jgi:hypothetical protein
MRASGCSTRCADGGDPAASVTSSAAPLRDIGLARAGAIDLSNEPFWKE